MPRFPHLFHGRSLQACPTGSASVRAEPPLGGARPRLRISPGAGLLGGKAKEQGVKLRWGPSGGWTPRWLLGRGLSWKWELKQCLEMSPTTAGGSGAIRVRVPPRAAFCCTEVVSPETNLGAPHLHRPEKVKAGKAHQDARHLCLS